MSNGIFAYMSKPGKSGKRKYCYHNYNTHEYSFDKLPGVEYRETKSVYTAISHWEEYEKMYSSLTLLKPRWKRIEVGK